MPNSGSKYSLLLTGASSVTNSNLSQRIESTNLQGIRDANSLTVSGYVRSATAGKTIQFYGLAPNATDDFSSYTLLGSLFSKTTMSGNGSGGTIGIGLTDADTWYYFTATATNVNAQTNFDKGLALYISVLSQTSSSHQVYFSQLQMEAGTTPTPFEHEDTETTLRKCQRYYFKFLEGNTKEIGVAWYFTAAHASFMLRYPTTMRATPTGIDTTGTGYYTIYRNAGSDAINSITFENGSTEQFSAFNNSEASGTAGQAGLIRSTNASAKIEFDAEL